MKNATDCAKKLTALLESLPAAEPPDLPDQDDPVAVLVQSFLMMNTTADKAGTAYRRLVEHVVDHNDLRVTMAQETVAYIGARYPQALDRSRRLRQVLRSIYLREHTVSLESLRQAGKRDVKKYLESLEGMVPYVSARVMLLCFDTHAIPVDDRLHERLVAAGAVDADADVSTAAAWLARQVRAGEGLDAHQRLQAWCDTAPKPAAGSRGKKASSRRAGASDGARTRTTKTTKRSPKKKTTTKSKTKSGKS